MSAVRPGLPARPGGVTARGSRVGPLGLVALMAAGAWLLRLALQAGSGASLHVDEAQYWDWSRSLQWGYYSKPPMIAALIRASTALFGDSETGLRALAMACHPAAAVVLAALAADIARDSGHAARAAGWTAAVYLASPIAALLGLVATTDAPLMLCWAAALAALWHAVERQRAWAWLLFGGVAGLGLMSKYSFAALIAGAAVWVVWRGRPGDRWRFAAALLPAAAMLMPNLLWNQAHDWPTWRHTAEITVEASRHEGSLAARLSALAAFGAGQWLIAGPLVLIAAVWRDSAGGRPGMPPSARWLCGCCALPLALAGLAQAIRGGAQLNWILPVHLSVTLWIGLRIASAAPPRRRLAAAALVVQLLLCSALAVAPRLAQAAQRPLPVALDAWARMRGWHETLRAIAPALAAEPRALLVFGSRQAMAQAAYHLRALDLPRAAWHEDGVARHHYALACPWAMHRGAAGQSVLFIGEGPPPPGGPWGRFEPLARVRSSVDAGRAVDLQLSRWHPAATSTGPGPERPSWCR